MTFLHSLISVTSFGADSTITYTIYKLATRDLLNIQGVQNDYCASASPIDLELTSSKIENYFLMKG
jgi:hypothetical protein